MTYKIWWLRITKVSTLEWPKKGFSEEMTFELSLDVWETVIYTKISEKKIAGIRLESSNAWQMRTC